MAHATSLPQPIAVPVTDNAAVPWYVWCCVLATTSATIGGVWDISWHESIGRDSFWTPAHMFIYLCGVLAGTGCGFLILSTTYLPASALRPASVRLWGFRAPLGAFIAAWGGLAMIVSAPFDNWWHNAYGLDVKVLSPPHTVLILGILSIRLGTLILILGAMNRASSPVLRSRLNMLFLYISALLLGGAMGAFMEQTLRILMHTARFYLIVALVAPLILAATSRASFSRWAATAAAGILMLIGCLWTWILPLFPAAPKLGPVYHQVTSLVPPEFPLLLLPAAFAYDVVRARGARWSDGRLALLAGPVFLAVFLAVQWPFAGFLVSAASRNWIFATQYMAYFIPSDSAYARNVFVFAEPTSGAFALTLAGAFGASIVSTRAGLSWGNWMRRIRR